MDSKSRGRFTYLSIHWMKNWKVTNNVQRMSLLTFVLLTKNKQRDAHFSSIVWNLSYVCCSLKNALATFTEQQKERWLTGSALECNAAVPGSNLALPQVSVLKWVATCNGTRVLRRVFWWAAEIQKKELMEAQKYIWFSTHVKRAAHSSTGTALPAT
jgi:hypothetical protein